MHDKQHEKLKLYFELQVRQPKDKDCNGGSYVNINLLNVNRFSQTVDFAYVL